MEIKRLLGLFFLLIPFLSNATEKDERAPGRITIDWLPLSKNVFPDESSTTSFLFKGASYNSDYLPVFVQTQKLISPASAVSAELLNIETEPLPNAEALEHPEKIGNDFDIQSRIVYRKKVPYASVVILPIRKSKSGNGFERLVSFELKTTSVSAVMGRSASRIYTHNSVLASGSWYRVGITQAGAYKLTYQQLKTMGMDVDNIDPRNLRVYGNGGGVLPFANSMPRYDDLQENAIQVTGESDGHFDASDYILFYGTAQSRWLPDATTGKFIHQINSYSDTTYFFVTADLGTGKRMLVKPSSTQASTHLVTSFDNYAFHEAESVNLLKSGREWYGETLDNLNNTRSFSFTLPNISTSDSILIRNSMIGRATNSGNNTFTIKLNGQVLSTLAFSSVGTSPQDNYAIPVGLTKTILPSSSNLNFDIQMSSSDPNALGWVNYLEVNGRCNLDMSGTGNSLTFRDTRSVGPGNVGEFRINNPPTGSIVWEITDPLNVSVQQFISGGGNIYFRSGTDELKEFAAFTDNNFLSPNLIGAVENQNLHALPAANLLIVTNPRFLQQANKLADFHRTQDNLNVAVATTQEIFNEFSSGSQDVSAIRDFVKMFYDRATSPSDMPHYLLVLGDASYDNKYRVSSNTNLVTSYQSSGSLNQTQTYMSDDFFGLLDDSEGDWSNGEIVDISVGRLPVKNEAEATAMVNKIVHYAGADNSVILPLSAQSDAVFGDWRNTVTFVADDQDSNTHFKQADTLARRVSTAYPILNIDKIYMDAYNQVATPGGNRYPDGHQALIDRVQRGTLLLTYIGHGGEVGWGHERFLEVADINNWTNYNSMPAFLTATCEFTRVDDPARTSAGELVLLNPQGGGICLFTTSRLAFSSSNYNLCQRFYTHVFAPIDGRMPTIGEIFEQTKIDVYSDQYVRNFLLIGDPALRLSYPRYTVRTTTINGVAITSPTDTLKAWSRITVTGEIQDQSGSKLTSFNGVIYPTVFDKWVTYNTLGNDRDVTNDPSYAAPFDLQKNIIYRGKASVANGDFSFTFVVPKDILFQYGFGKLSYYAQNGQTDAAGFYSNVLVGGINTSVIPDNHGPEVKLYINDDKFVRGGLTNDSPILYAIINDSSGVNTVGTGIGHDMTAQLDEDNNKIFVLNDYYENDLNSYQQGRVKFPFKGMEAGPHTLHFKVWDVFNNSSESTTDFVVSESAKLALQHVLNYPNPFTTHTTFMFEHNRPFSELQVQVQIFTVSGKLIKTLSDRIYTEGYRSNEIEWNGLDDYGDRIGKGVYIYKLRVKTSQGDYADKFEKLVILR